MKDQCNSPMTPFRRYKLPSSMRRSLKQAAYILPAFRQEEWGHKSNEQNTNVRTIRSIDAILDSNTRKNRNTSAGKRTAALGKYEVKAGWLIPAVLEQQLNSDLPGLIRAWFGKTYMTRLRASTF
jgi:type IV secretory pathway VirB10-like protein